MEKFCLLLVALLIAYCVQGGLSFVIRQLTDPVTVAEGVFWDAEKYALFYGDVATSTVYRRKWGEKKSTSTKIPKKTISSVIPIKGSRDDFIVTAYRDVVRLTWDGRQDTGTVKDLEKVGSFGNRYELNDAKADSTGRVWVGTYQLQSSDRFDFKQGGGGLFSLTITDDDKVIIEEKISNLTFPNGLAWSHDDKHFYYTDSATRTIERRDFDVETGTLGDSKIVFDLGDYPEYHGVPDGITVNDDGDIDAAIFNASVVVRIDKVTGKIIETGNYSVPHLTAVEWGGPNNDHFFTGSMKFSQDEEYVHKYPNAGAVFMVTNLTRTGRPSRKVVVK
ncbi:regucalcin-like [Cylas formicarius]|uniref:regucalcin-like n=1 Tax=Cylas formicarius TaxID=197179 RepID=UPI002958B5F3|nr:regucalcin-like [Cylas formicarius]XP_060526637.1 regucalcin-like [Cylas formicarius]